MGSSRSSGVQSVGRSIALLERFTLDQPVWSISELAREAGISKATVHRLLTTMEQHGVIEKDEDSREYRLGLKLLELGSRVSAVLDPARRAEPHLRSLVEDLGETAHLAVLHQGRALYVAKYEASRALRMPSAVGSSNPVHCTAMGKALLAFQSRSVQERILTQHGLSRHTDNTITDRKELDRELARIRHHGFAVDNEELERGLRCVAAPVFGHTGEVVGAVGTSGPAGRLEADADGVTARVIGAAEAIGRDLGAAMSSRESE